MIKSKLCTHKLNYSTVQQPCLALIKQRGVVTIVDHWQNKSPKRLKQRIFARTIALKGDTVEQTRPLTMYTMTLNDLSHDNLIEWIENDHQGNCTLHISDMMNPLSVMKLNLKIDKLFLEEILESKLATQHCPNQKTSDIASILEWEKLLTTEFKPWQSKSIHRSSKKTRKQSAHSGGVCREQTTSKTLSSPWKAI